MDKMKLWLGLIFLGFAPLAQAIVIGPNTVINASTTYSNTVVDLSHGNFIIRKGASLVIQNSQIIGTLSEQNPTLILVELGSLKLIENTINISAPSLDPHPDVQSLAYVIRLEQANVDTELSNNIIKMDKPFVGGLIITSINIPTNQIRIMNNHIEGFHGVLYLLNSANAVIGNNEFKLNSYGNIVLSGKGGQILNNKIYFSGRDRLGNAMDIINSSDVLIRGNLLWTPTCHGIYVFLSQNITLDNNLITGGITYAITLLSKSELNDKDRYAIDLIDLKKRHLSSSKNIIIINNYLSQNRYGIAASDVEGLIVKDNYFSQRFSNSIMRKFWTDNNILFQNVSDLVWTNNLYKESFTQDNNGNNQLTEITNFPESGGVSL